MTMDILAAVIGAIGTLLAAGFASTELVRKLLYRILGKTEPKKTYTERLGELTRSLTNASGEVDSILAELSKVAKAKEESVTQLEQGLSELEKREKELKETVEALENVPIPVAEHFAKLMKSEERRSTKMDYILFGAGVVVTTLITIIIQIFSG